MNIKESAKAYEKKSYKGIEEIDSISVDLDMKDGEGESGNGETFRYQYIIVDGAEVRVPKSVLSQLKDHLAANPEIEHFRVTKKGKGFSTEYTVIPLKE